MAALLAVPSWWPRAGEYLCAGRAQVIIVSSNFNAASLEELSSLGSCPSSIPGDGSLSLDGSGTVRASLDGRQLVGSTSTGSCGPEACAVRVVFDDGDGFILFRPDASESTGAASVQSGVLVLMPTKDLPLRLSCLGSGATAVGAVSGLTIQAPHLELPRSCPGEPVEGALGVGIGT
jgi:hypothetical protein